MCLEAPLSISQSLLPCVIVSVRAEIRTYSSSLQVSDDSSSDEEYVLISALTGTITHGSNDWLIESGASKHMTGFKESFVKLSEHESPNKVKLGDDY